ncbi:MAG: VCBS repeat-containing protein [Planctomycetes bacterium]|nr:VCBS repeat-containing protein [Planctomycetota bacterium]
MNPSFSKLTLLSLTLLSLSLAVPAQINLAAGVSYLTGSQPDGLVSGDFNADGLPDLAMTVDAPDRILVLPGTGMGLFGAPITTLVGAGTSPHSLFAADFDLNGVLDLAVTLQNSNQVQIWSGTGAGTFTLSGSTAVGLEPRAITGGDFDGDGDIDLASGNRDGNSASILLNNGLGAFPTATTISAGSDIRDIAAGDLDGDGDLDLLLSSHDTRTLERLVNNGGSFTVGASLFVGGQVRPEGIAIADVNGDGQNDVLAAANGGGFEIIAIFLGATGPAMKVNTLGIDTSDVAAADLDGDGDLDLATANKTSNNVSILQNLGAATFSAPQLLPAGTSPEVLLLADLNLSGLADVAVANRDSNNVTVFLNGMGTTGGGATYPGSNEDFVLRTGVNGPATATADIKTMTAGNNIVVEVDSPNGSYDFTIPVLIGQFIPTGFVPGGTVAGFPEIQFNPSFAFIIYDGSTQPIFGGGLLPPAGLSFAFQAIPGFAGNSVFLQALSIAPSAQTGNQFFTASDAHELQVL